MIEKLINMIKEVMEEIGLTYEQTAENTIIVQFNEYIMGLGAGERILELCMLAEKPVEALYGMEILELINWINIMTKEGHWELDGDGYVNFRITTDALENGELGKEHVKRIILSGMRELFAFGESIKQAGCGSLTVVEALKEGLGARED